MDQDKIDKLRISGGEVAEDWGNTGVELILIRKRITGITNFFHWGTAIKCLRTEQCIVLNRDEGLDLQTNKTLD